MKIQGRVAVVTGAASGIGLALSGRLVQEGAAAVVMADRRADALRAAAAGLGASAHTCDVGDPAQVRALVDWTTQRFGPVEAFFSNAGVVHRGDESTPDEAWDASWRVNLMAHVFAARAVLPGMAQRGSGAFVISASAAGLLNHIDAASYAVTKSAAVSLAEFLAIRWGDSGVQVAVLCPQQVRTPMTEGLQGTVSAVDGCLEPAAVAQCVVEGLAAGRFLLLPHAAVREHLRRKGDDTERWLRGMRRLRHDQMARRGPAAT